MSIHEYKVIPAPSRPAKAKGVKTTAEKFALSLTGLMNEMGRDGWEYVRAETLPCEEKKGWTRRADTSFQTLLVFRREVTPTQLAATPPLSAENAPRVPAAPAAMPLRTAPLTATPPEGPTPPILPGAGPGA